MDSKMHFRWFTLASKKATIGKGVIGAHRLGGYLAPLDTSSIQFGITGYYLRGAVFFDSKFKDDELPTRTNSDSSP